MKMEVLPVHNQFNQGQFDVIRSNKIRDWSRVLTTPTTNDGLSAEAKGNLRSRSVSKSSTNSTLLFVPPIPTAASSVIENVVETSWDVSPLALEESHESLNALSFRLQEELRAAKSRHLACTEVLLPADLLHRVAAEMIKASEREPCGIRGCCVYIEFEDEHSNSRTIATLKVDADTVSTFELYLTLKQDKSGWTSLLPQFLRNLARLSTIMISRDFTLKKHNLYNS